MTLVSGLTSGLTTGLTSGLVATDAVSLIRNGRFNNLFTRTRASDVTYIDSDGLLKVAGDNVFPVDYSQGFPAQALFEGSENLTPNGDRMEVWTLSETTRVLDGTEAIANYKNATLLTASGASSVAHFLASPDNASFANGSTYTLSVFAKAGTTNRFQLTATSAAFGSSQYANFGLTGNGSVLASAGGTARIERVNDDGWYRCSFTLDATSTASGSSLAVGFIDSDTATRFPAFVQSGESVYLFGGQTEAKDYPTPYIPTDGSTASRAEPSVSIAGTNFSSFYNQSEGTFVIDYLQPYIATPSARLFQFDNGNDNTKIAVFEINGVNARFSVDDGGISQVSIDSTINNVGTQLKTAIAYKENDFASVTTGETVLTDTNGSVPTVDRLFIVNRSDLNRPASAYIKSITYYPRRLPNAQLEDLTA